MEIIIRKAISEDSKIADMLLTKLILDEKKYNSNINEKFVVKSWYNNLIDDPNKCILIATHENNIVGYLYGFELDNLDLCLNSVAQLDAIYVDENYRRNQIGDMLIKEFKKWCIEKKIRYIEVKVYESNTKAIHLYKKNEFINTSKIMALEL